MDVEISDRNDGKLVKIISDKDKVALVIKDEENERIYLPGSENNNSTYYVENSTGLTKTDYGFRVLHKGEITELELLG